LVNGTGMLFHQAVLANEIWTGKKIEGDRLQEIFQAFTKMMSTKEK